MPTSSPQEITELLIAWGNGDEAALAELTPLVYQELHRLARGYLRRERPGHALQTTALVHEAYLRLIDWKNVRWQNRAHFFGVSAQLMRRILVDFARSRDYAKRGGDVHHVSLEAAVAIAPTPSVDIIDLDDALKRLGALASRQSHVVELRFFGGLNITETAEVLKVSEGTVRRDWSLAQAWLLRELSRQ